MSERKGEKKINYCTTLVDRRRESDRRTHTVQALITGSFAPRRRGPRRRADMSLTATDWHHPQWLAVGMLIILLSAADALLTLRLLAAGASEGNPLMAGFLNGGAYGFSVVKMLLTAGGVVLLTLAARLRAFGRLPVAAVLYTVLVAYVALVGYELWLLRTLDPFD
jgi:hypothetical protein